MSLIATIKEMASPLKIATNKKEATRLFLTGIEKHKAFDTSIKAARKQAVEAGFYFLRSRAAFDHGEWGVFCEVHRERISNRAIYNYMQLAELQARYVVYKDPTVTNLEDIIRLSVEQVLISPLPLVALTRELNHVLKFGGYFQEDYENKKLRLAGAGQFEFQFDKVSSTLDVLSHLGESNFTFKFPEGKDETEAWGEVETKLETALARVREMKQGRTIDA